MLISGHTRVAGIIGSPVKHSLSPALYNAAFEATGLDWVYVAFEVAPGRAVDALDAMRTLGLAALAVTMPHKADVAANVDELSPDAAALGAVNCVTVDDGRLVGHNTDGAGFVRGLRYDAGFDPVGCRAVVLGAGGAGKAVAMALGRAGAADVAVVNRTTSSAAVAAELAGAAGRVGSVADIERADLVVNSTSLGMSGMTGGYPAPPEACRAGCVAVDLIYNPLETAWLAALRSRGIAVFNGVSMLAFQAVEQFERYTGQRAPVDTMVGAVRRAMNDTHR